MKIESITYKYIYYALLLAGMFYFLFILLHTTSIEPVWKNFSDSYDYKKQSEYSLFSTNFYSPKPEINFSPRSFTVPLFYKIADSNPFKMVLLQKAVYAFCIVILIFSILASISSKLVKLTSAFLLLYFFTWWNIVGWSNNILTESISMSLMFLWIAMILFYFKKQSTTNLLLMIGTGILLSFTRDTWPYLILLFSVMNALIFMLFKRDVLKKNILLIIVSLLLFFIQEHTSSIGEHHKLPLFNSLAGRIAQNDEYTKWFKEEGMPVSELLQTDFKGIMIDRDENRSTVYSKYNDSSYIELFNWIIKDGKSKYKEFLLTHPSYFFLLDQSKEQKERIFSTNLFGYTLAPKGFFMNAHNTFPLFNTLFLVIVVITLAIISIKQKMYIFLFPFILSTLFLFNALFCYNADGLEVNRHLALTQIMIEFISLISIIFILHILSEQLKNSKKISAINKLFLQK